MSVLKYKENGLIVPVIPGNGKTVSYGNTQNLTEQEKALARSNIGASATTGDMHVADYDPDGTVAEAGGIAEYVDKDNVALQDGDYSGRGLVSQYAKNLLGILTPHNASNVVFRPTASNFSGSGWSADSISGQTATIEKIKGKTLVFNQLCENGNFASTSGWGSAGYGTLTASNNVCTFTLTAPNGASRIQKNVDLVKNHYYLCGFYAKSDKPFNFRTQLNGIVFGTQISASNSYQFCGGISKMTYDSGVQPMYLYNVANSCEVGDICYYKNVMLIDLTQMYGSGREPQTVAEFKAQFPLDYYAYNKGELISLNATGLKTNGFNQWDEEWEVGAYSDTTGEKITDSRVICKNLIRVFPNTLYAFTVPQGHSLFPRYYDSLGNFIGVGASITGNGTQTTPSNAQYVAFQTDLGYGTVYKNDICINIAWSGIRNGEYEAGWNSELSLPIADYFADGMKSAGTVYDELTKDKAVKRIGKVDLGSLTWAKYGASTPNTFIATGALDGKAGDYSTIANMKIAGYTLSNWVNTVERTVDKSICFRGFSASDKRIVIVDTAYTDATAFKTAMSGKYLYYELETPVETPINPPLNPTYRCDDFGTEMLLPQNTSTELLTAPMDMEVVYGIDYEANIRNLPTNYPNNNFVNALANAFRSVGINMTATNNNGSWTVTMSSIT